ncbi:hypothetical protein [Piscinibacter sakaiensis]|uniref:hypothetical protein n=1 Tax=Piscinibacter sakaiensis TaxID=1547922 RepID=UPI003AB00CE8
MRRLAGAIALLRAVRWPTGRLPAGHVPAAKAGTAQRGKRPGSLGPGDMPRRGTSAALAAATVALLAIGAWWVLSAG